MEAEALTCILKNTINETVVKGHMSKLLQLNVDQNTIRTNPN